jgi:hypothetical protein
MAGKKMRSNKTRKASYDTYKVRGNTEKNKQRKLERHMKKHPNDAQAAKADGKVGRTRKTPSVRLFHRNTMAVQEAQINKLSKMNFSGTFVPMLLASITKRKSRK